MPSDSDALERLRIRRAPAPRWRRIPQSERDPKAKACTDEALRTTDDYDHQEMYQLSEAARQAAAKAKRLEEHNHAHAAHAEAAAVK